MALVGKGSFIVGLVIAAAAGVGFEQAWFGWALAVLGLKKPRLLNACGKY